jgi:hypothetical protein
MNKNQWVGGYLIVGGGLMGLASVIALIATAAGEIPDDVSTTSAVVSSLFGLTIASVNIYAGSIVWNT